MCDWILKNNIVGFNCIFLVKSGVLCFLSFFPKESPHLCLGFQLLREVCGDERTSVRVLESFHGVHVRSMKPLRLQQLLQLCLHLLTLSDSGEEKSWWCCGGAFI